MPVTAIEEIAKFIGCDNAKSTGPFAPGGIAGPEARMDDINTARGRS